VDIPRPARTLNLSAKLKDTANTETPQLSFQRKAVQDFHFRQADKDDPPPSLTVGANPNAPSSASTIPTPQNTSSIFAVADSDSDDEGGIVGEPTAPCKSMVIYMSQAYFLMSVFLFQPRQTMPQ
jgi:hypothetical protein